MRWRRPVRDRVPGRRSLAPGPAHRRWPVAARPAALCAQQRCAGAAVRIEARTGAVLWCLALFGRPAPPCCRANCCASAASINLRIGQAHNWHPATIRKPPAQLRDALYRMGRRPAASRHEPNRNPGRCGRSGAAGSELKLRAPATLPMASASSSAACRGSPLLHELDGCANAFRTVGEGTGKRLDLDRYDAWYEQIVLWDAGARHRRRLPRGQRRPPLPNMVWPVSTPTPCSTIPTPCCRASPPGWNWAAASSHPNTGAAAASTCCGRASVPTCATTRNCATCSARYRSAPHCRCRRANRSSATTATSSAAASACQRPPPVHPMLARLRRQRRRQRLPPLADTARLRMQRADALQAIRRLCEPDGVRFCLRRGPGFSGVDGLIELDLAHSNRANGRGIWGNGNRIRGGVMVSYPKSMFHAPRHDHLLTPACAPSARTPAPVKRRPAEREPPAHQAEVGGRQRGSGAVRGVGQGADGTGSRPPAASRRRQQVQREREPQPGHRPRQAHELISQKPVSGRDDRRR